MSAMTLGGEFVDLAMTLGGEFVDLAQDVTYQYKS